MTEKDEVLKEILERLERLEGKISEMSAQREEPAIKVELPPALARILKTLTETDKPLSTTDLAKNAGISRNLASGYVNRLVEMGMASKLPNLNRETGSKYLYAPRPLPREVKRLLDFGKQK